MSVQACEVTFLGYRFDPNQDQIFSFINKDNNGLFDFIDEIDSDIGYYQFRDKEISDHKIYTVFDGMCGEYFLVGFPLRSHYIENTHGDEYWSHEYNKDLANLQDEERIQFYKERIEVFLQRKLNNPPSEITVEHYQ